MSTTKGIIDFEEVLECRGVGMSYEETAAHLRCGKNTVVGACMLVDAARRGNYERAAELIKRYNISKDCIAWVAGKFGLTIEQLKGETKAKDAAKEEPKQAAAPAVDYSIYFQRMLELQAQTNELLNQLMDVVVPKYTSDMKDNVNANCDVIGQSLKRMEDKMEAIKIGVRRKGM